MPDTTSDPGVTEHEPGARAEPALVGVDLLEPMRQQARSLGFARLGITRAAPMPDARERLASWLAAGHEAGLGYLRGGERADPRAVFPAARSVVVVALVYPTPSRVERAREGAALSGAVAAYARGTDYHLVMKEKLRVLAQWLATASGRTLRARIAVDSAPLLERELAVRAGLGFIGKSTLLIVPGVGTNVLLGELLIDLELAPTEIPVAPGCGDCRLCIEACPTGAITAPFSVDAGRCISYWTIEHHAAIPPEVRPGLGSHVFGCDECQAVCPFDASAAPRASSPELAGRIAESGLDLLRLLAAGNAEYRKLVRRTALRRVSRDVLARNAAVALGNLADAGTVPALGRALSGHPSPIVRGHAAWALGRIGGDAARALLEDAREDPDPSVRQEVSAALGLDGWDGSEYP